MISINVIRTYLWIWYWKRNSSRTGCASERSNSLRNLCPRGRFLQGLLGLRSGASGRSKLRSTGLSAAGRSTLCWNCSGENSWKGHWKDCPSLANRVTIVGIIARFLPAWKFPCHVQALDTWRRRPKASADTVQSEYPKLRNPRTASQCGIFYKTMYHIFWSIWAHKLRKGDASGSNCSVKGKCPIGASDGLTRLTGLEDSKCTLKSGLREIYFADLSFHFFYLRCAIFLCGLGKLVRAFRFELLQLWSNEHGSRASKLKVRPWHMPLPRQIKVNQVNRNIESLNKP